jgi:two-component sensor histidine kinase
VGSVLALSTKRHHNYRLLSMLWILLVLGGLTFYLVRTYQATYELVSVSSRNEAEVLSRSMNSAMRRARTDMAWAETAMGNAASSEDRAAVGAYLAAQTQRFPEIHGYVMYGPDARPLISTMEANQLCEGDLSSYVDASTPNYSYGATVDCAKTGTRTMLMHRLLQDSRGETVGTIAAVINLSYYEQLFSRVDVGRTGMVSIRRTDTSRLVARWPIELERMNNMAPDIPPQQMIEGGATHGVVRYVGATDGVERIFAYRRVENDPFYVLIGRGYDEQFASWRTISAIAAAAALMMVLMTLLLLRRLNQETADLVTADAVLRKALTDKEGLIRELLHRTNNSLQVIRSLVQLELITDEATGNRTAPERLDYRIGVLSLVQQMLREENNYTWIPLHTYLEKIRTELLQTHPLPVGATCEIHCPETKLLLDAATPIGLIVGELCYLSATSTGSQPTGSVGSRIDLTVRRDDTETITMVYADTRAFVPDDDTVRLITSLGEHQLAGSVAFETDEQFRCTVTFKPDRYAPRVVP